MERIGIRVGQSFDLNAASPEIKDALERGAAEARSTIGKGERVIGLRGVHRRAARVLGPRRDRHRTGGEVHRLHEAANSGWETSAIPACSRPAHPEGSP